MSFNRFPTAMHRPSLLRSLSAFCIAASACMPLALAQSSTPVEHDMTQHSMHMPGNTPAASKPSTSKTSTRIAVQFPPAAKRATLSEMRMHLQTLGAIQTALSSSEFELAARLAENKLGVSSMRGDMYDSARFMPKGMREMGYAMHQSASQFAIVAQDASVTGDVRPALAALAKVTENCVACHTAYALK